MSIRKNKNRMKSSIISVITISYNCKNEIEKTIQSVQCLDYPNIEYIIIDGASKDGTLEVINKYRNVISFVVSEPDKGIYDAMNKGIQKATGDWIIFMNAGDTFHSRSCVSELMAKVHEDTIIAYGDIVSVHEKYRYRVPKSPIEEMATHMTVRHQATFTRLSYHKRHLFDISFRSSGDYNFFYKAYFQDHVSFQYIPIVIADFEADTGTSSVNYRWSFRENLRIWGKENDVLFKLKHELKFVRWDFIGWIKKVFLSDSQKMKFKILMLKRNGIKEIEIN